MAGTLWGADVQQLRTLAQQFSKTADLLQQQSTQLSSQINNNPAWKGADAQRFRSDWNTSHRTLLQQAVARLQQESKVLLKNAEEQEQASTNGPGGTGAPEAAGSSTAGSKDPFQLGPDWLADSDGSPFRKGWDTYNLIKAFPNLRAGLFDLPHFFQKADSVKEFILSADFRAESKAFQEANPISKMFNTSSELFDGKWDKALALSESGKAAKFFEFGGNALGGLGVGLDALDAVNHFKNDEVGEGFYSVAKAALGAVSFVPPPVGTVAMVASGALAIYDNVPAVKEKVNEVGESIAHSATAAWNGATEAADKVGQFFGF